MSVTQDNSSSNVIQQINQTETHYEIERDFINDNFEIIFKLRVHSIILCKFEAFSVIALCRKLDFVLNRFVLVKYLKNRRVKIDTNKKTHCVSFTCDLIDSNDIYDALSITQAHTHVAKIKRAYEQMRLFDFVNKKDEEQTVIEINVTKKKLYFWHFEKRVIRKANNVVSDEKKIIIQNYKNEYLNESKWTNVCKWFKRKKNVLISWLQIRDYLFSFKNFNKSSFS